MARKKYNPFSAWIRQMKSNRYRIAERIVDAEIEIDEDRENPELWKRLYDLEREYAIAKAEMLKALQIAKSQNSKKRKEGNDE